MDVEDLPPDGPPRSVAARAAAWFQASPLELVGLTILLLGALMVTGLVVWDGWRRPTELPPAASVGSIVDHVPPADGAGQGGHDHPSAGSGPGSDPSAEALEETEVVVHVSGAVQSGGVVTLAAGSRVADALAAAGGATAEADTDRLNLARVLTDGEQVHVPIEGEAMPQVQDPAGSGGVDADGVIDLNLATQEHLETLPGIGPAKAAAILEHRETVGPFQTPGDLRAVAGIGEMTFQRLADLVTVR